MMKQQVEFSIIIPVYNRPNEVEELLESLLLQTFTDFEVVIVEDGSSEPCKEVVDRYTALNIQYYSKPNSGRSLTRNYGMARANGRYLIFFDSDCIIPERYFEQVYQGITTENLDCYGGPDKAHASFTPLQKAISQSMTSFLTTGGIRGRKKGLETFMPRTFNMGFSKEVYDKVGDFKDMFGEDIDLSSRIKEAGFRIGLIPEAFVYHKRRTGYRSFFHQVFVFGMARVDLYRLHPESLKLVHLLPAFFVLGVWGIVACSLLFPTFILLFLLPAFLFVGTVFIEALFLTKSLRVSLLSVMTSFIQLYGYGAGFIKAFFRKIVCKNGDDNELLNKYYKKKK